MLPPSPRLRRTGRGRHPLAMTRKCMRDKKTAKKPTKQRLKNVALYYLERYSSSMENLKKVLKRRVDKYTFENAEYDKAEAYGFIDEIAAEFEGYGYLNDENYAEMKVKNYLAAGKSKRYILEKMREKGVDLSLVEKLFENSEYDSFEAAMRLAKKKKIGPFRAEEARKEFWQKDAGVLLRAGFEFEVVKRVLGTQKE